MAQRFGPCWRVVRPADAKGCGLPQALAPCQVWIVAENVTQL